MEDAKARLRERLSKRRSNAASLAKKEGGSITIPAQTVSSPIGFSTLRVQSLLESHAELKDKLKRNTTTDITDSTPRKSNSTVPRSVEVPLSSEKRQLFVDNNANTTPQISNARKAEVSKTTLDELLFQQHHHDEEIEDSQHQMVQHHHHAEEIEDSHHQMVQHHHHHVEEIEDSQHQIAIEARGIEKEAMLMRETTLALALGIPDEDESSSILQLAQEVQRAAEDELTFYGGGSFDSTEQWSAPKTGT